MRIPQIDLTPQHEELKSELMAAFEDILAKGSFILGEYAERCEKDIAGFLGVNHAIGCNSGTDALILALLALDVGPGDEVITSPFSFFASGGAIARVGATPVFADIDPEYYTLRPDLVAAAITDRTKAIIPVHIFGQAADMDALSEIAAERGNLPIIEDAAQSIGARWHNKQTGSLSELACLSFYPTKNLAAVGDAGMVVTSDDKLADRLRSLRSHGERPKYHHHELGMNSRISTICAASISIKLKHIERWHKQRNEIATVYNEAFAASGIPENLVTLPKVRANASHCYHQFSIRAQNRDALKDYLADQGVGTAIHYPGVIYAQPCFGTTYPPGLCPEAELLTREILSLPMYPQLPHHHVEEVVQLIKRFYTK